MMMPVIMILAASESDTVTVTARSLARWPQLPGWHAPADSSRGGLVTQL